MLRLGGRLHACCASECATSGPGAIVTPVSSVLSCRDPKYRRVGRGCQGVASDPFRSGRHGTNESDSRHFTVTCRLALSVSCLHVRRAGRLVPEKESQVTIVPDFPLTFSVAVQPVT